MAPSSPSPPKPFKLRLWGTGSRSRRATLLSTAVLLAFIATGALAQDTGSVDTYNEDILDPPVPAEPARAPAIPIINLSELYILGQINDSRTDRDSGFPQQNDTTQDTLLRPRHLDALAADSDAQPLMSPWSPLLPRQAAADGPIQCTPTTPCKDGSCCNSEGKCGYKDVHCGDTCISHCNAKAMCGIDSPEGSTSCALNLCCSFYGWCGTKSVHCIDPEPQFGLTPCQAGYGGCAIIPPPTCGTGSGTATARKIAYYQSWNVRDRQCNKITPANIKTEGLTHLFFAFAFIDPASFGVIPMNDGDIALYTEFTALKKPGLQTWIAIGGWGMTDPGPFQTVWSDMASTQANRAAFIQSCIGFMQTWGFQGIDLDWEYPAAEQRGGRPEDTQNLVALVREMRAAFGTTYGITSILAPDYWYLRGFDPKGMEPYVDWFGFMAYDLHGYWDADVLTLGKIVRPQTDIREIDEGLLPLWFAGIDPAKVVLGLAYYGRGYTLSDPACPWMGCSFTGPNEPGRCTGFAGVLSNLEIQELITEKGLFPDLIADAMVKQISWDGNQWMGYDDAETIAMKTGFANNRCLGGTMIWSIDFDSGSGSGSVPVIGNYQSPVSATITPIAGTTYAATQTFTYGAIVTSVVGGMRNQGNQNVPIGPGPAACEKCDLLRLLTSTCCGSGGSITNPVVIEAGIPLPKDLLLPRGYVPTIDITDDAGVVHLAGVPLTSSIRIVAGTVFPTPFTIIPGTSLGSRSYWDADFVEPEDDDDDDDVTMYIIDTFWLSASPTIICDFPCVISLPATTIKTTWTPSPRIRSTTFPGTTVTWTLPEETVQSHRIRKTTIEKPPGPETTQSFQPEIDTDNPVCIEISVTLPIFGKLTVRVCPPPLPSFDFPKPPRIVVRPPGPPGPEGIEKPGPTNPGNKPGPGHVDPTTPPGPGEVEPTATVTGSSCPLFDSNDLPQNMFPPGQVPGQPSGSNPPSATSAPTTSGSGSDGDAGGNGSAGGVSSTAPSTPAPGVHTVTITVGIAVTVTQHVSRTTTITSIYTPPIVIPKPAPNPDPFTEQPHTEKSGHCYSNNIITGFAIGATQLKKTIEKFCNDNAGKEVSEKKTLKAQYKPEAIAVVDFSINAKSRCVFKVDGNECRRLLNMVVDGCKGDDPWIGGTVTAGGTITNNCATYKVDPNPLKTDTFCWASDNIWSCS